MRAIMVSVNYSDILALTVPYNRHHFDEVYIITSHDDRPNVLPIAEANDCELLATDLFYQSGASFNKWAALEWGLDRMGREGWLTIMDADVLWPTVTGIDRYIHKGLLLGPRRRMLDPIPRDAQGRVVLPPEEKWVKYPLHRQERELAGYSQIFHASDPHLGPAPWHETDWKHAGGADSFFQAKWPEQCKSRPPWCVLHLGPAGQNWMGRATPYLDGTLPPDAEQKQRQVRAIWEGRRGKFGPDKFKHEKIR